MIEELRHINPRIVFLLLHIRTVERNPFTGESVDPSTPRLRAEELRAIGGTGRRGGIADGLEKLKGRVHMVESPVVVLSEICIDDGTPGCAPNDSGSLVSGGVPEFMVTTLVAKLFHQQFGLKIMDGFDSLHISTKSHSVPQTVEGLNGHDGSFLDGFRLSPVGFFILIMAPWPLYLSVKWAIGERKADQMDRMQRSRRPGSRPHFPI